MKPQDVASTSIAKRSAFTIVELLIVIAIIGILVSLLLVGVQKARSSARTVTCLSNLRQLGVAFQNYHSDHGHLPFDLHRSAWARLLPYLGESVLYDEIEWDALGSGGLIAQGGPPPATKGRDFRFVKLPYFVCPEGRSDVPNGSELNALTSYGLCAGTVRTHKSWDGVPSNDGIFSTGFVSRLDLIKDGLSQTMVVGEIQSSSEGLNSIHPTAVGKIIDIESSATNGQQTTEAAIAQLQAECQTAASGNPPPVGVNACLDDWFTFNSNFSTLLPPGGHGCRIVRTMGPETRPIVTARPAGVLHNQTTGVCFADGSAKQISKNVDLKVWRAIGTVAGNETVSPNY